MEVSVSLDAVLARRAAENALRVAELRAQRQREEAARAPVKYGEAGKDKGDAEAADPAAVYDPVHDKGRRLDVEV